MKRLLFLTIVLIVYGSLYPWEFQWRSAESPFEVLLRSWPVVVDRFLLRDIAINVLMYLPLGLAAFVVFARRLSRTRAALLSVLLGFALSTSMELLQVFVPGRVSSLLDVTTNSTGTVAGVLAGLLLGRPVERLVERHAARLAAAAALLLACWGTFQAYPFFPAISHAKLRNAVAAFLHGFPLSMPAVWADGAEWFAVALAAKAVFGKWSRCWPLAALGLLAARLVIATRGVTPNEVAGAALATLVWMAIPDRAEVRAGVWWLVSGLLLRELAPFHFSGQAQHFSWIPFTPTLESEWQGAVVILSRKAFDYGAMVWLLRRDGVGYLKAGISVAAALLVLEMLQIYLPGRTPEVTDSVLALLMVWGLKRMDR